MQQQLNKLKIFVTVLMHQTCC